MATNPANPANTVEGRFVGRLVQPTTDQQRFNGAFQAGQGTSLALTRLEFDLLNMLLINAGRVLTHQSILIRVWGPEYADNVEYLRVFISQLRKKLEKDPHEPSRLISEPGVGYRFTTGE